MFFFFEILKNYDSSKCSYVQKCHLSKQANTSVTDRQMVKTVIADDNKRSTYKIEERGCCQYYVKGQNMTTNWMT